MRTEARSDITAIAVGYDATAARAVRIAVGPCRVRVRRGEGAEWIRGSYRDPTRLLPLAVVADASGVRLAQRADLRDVSQFLAGVPTLELELGTKEPFSLTLEGGANDNVLDLGGVPLCALTVRAGAGKIEVRFSSPNATDMTDFSVAAGAAEVEIADLANANAALARIEGGAASFRVGLGGALRRDLHVLVSSGVSGVVVRVPQTTAARIRSEGLLVGVDADALFAAREGAYWTKAAVAGEHPSIEVQARVVLGSLSLRSL